MDELKLERFDGAEVRRRRLLAGTKPTPFSAACGISAVSLWRLELGGGTPSLDTLTRVAAVLGCRVGDLFIPADKVA